MMNATRGRKSYKSSTGLFSLLRIGLLAAAVFAVGDVSAETVLTGSETAYKFYRFKIDDYWGGYHCQLSEVRLYNGKDDVTRPYVNLSHDQSLNIIPNQGPEVAVDGKLETTWCWVFNASVAWFVLEYAEPILVTKYEWYVGGDTKTFPTRNPMGWRLEGSNDGTNWIPLDVKEGQGPTNDNCALAYTWNLFLKDGTTFRAYNGPLTAADLFAGCTEVLKASSGELDASAVTSYPALTIDAGCFSVQNGSAAAYTVTGALTLKGGVHLRLDATTQGCDHFTAGSFVLADSATAENPVVIEVSATDLKEVPEPLTLLSGGFQAADLAKFKLTSAIPAQLSVDGNGALVLSPQKVTDATWTGDAQDGGKWSTANNWQNAPLSVAGANLSFDLQAGGTTEMDFATGLTVGSVTAGPAAGAFTHTGDAALYVTGGLTNLSTAAQTFALPLRLGSSDPAFSISTVGSLVFQDVRETASSVTKDGAGELTVPDTLIYGVTNIGVNAGTLKIGSRSGVPASQTTVKVPGYGDCSGVIRIANGARLDVAAEQSPDTLAGGEVTHGKLIFVEGDGPDGKGALYNSKEVEGFTGPTFGRIVLTGDASVGGKSRMDIRRLIGSKQSDNETNSWLEGPHTFTVKDMGVGYFAMWRMSFALHKMRVTGDAGFEDRLHGTITNGVWIANGARVRISEASGLTDTSYAVMPFVVEDDATASLEVAGSSDSTMTSAFTFGAGAELAVTTLKNLTLAGAVTNSGAVVQTGAGAFYLNGTLSGNGSFAGPKVRFGGDANRWIITADDNVTNKIDFTGVTDAELFKGLKTIDFTLTGGDLGAGKTYALGPAGALTAMDLPNIELNVKDATGAEISAGNYLTIDDGVLTLHVADPRKPVIAVWTGAVDNNLSNPGNWSCTNEFGAVAKGQVPLAYSEVRFGSGDCRFTCPVGTTFSYKSIAMGDMRLVDECDWRGLDLSKVTAGTIDLNGHDLRLSLAATPANAITFTDTTDVGGTLHVEVVAGRTVNFGTYAFEGSLKLAKEMSGALELTAETAYGATGDFALTDGSSVKATGAVAFADGAATVRALDFKSAFDLNGQTVAARTIYDNGTLKNGAAGKATVVLGRGDTDATLGFVPPANTKLKKEGAGTLTVNGVPAMDLEIANGTVVCQKPAFRHYRFVVLRAWGSACNSIQFSEFKLLDGETDVTEFKAGFKHGPSDCPSNGVQGPDVAVDGQLDSVFLDFHGAAGSYASYLGQIYIQFDYAEPRPITGYNWATGGDMSNENEKGRDPSDWLLLGSDDEQTWVTLDKRTGYNATRVRNTWAEPNGFSLTSGTSTGISGAADTTLKLDDVDLALSGSQMRVGTLDLANGSRLKITRDVSQCKWFRFSIKQLEGGNIMQISEFALYDEAGNRVNKGLNLVSSASALTPGQMAVSHAGENDQGGDKLFDDDKETKWCVTQTTPSSASPEVVTMRLADNAAPVASYNFATGLDTASFTTRNPKAWTLEASVDGKDWAVVDERSVDQGPHENMVWYNNNEPYVPSFAMNGSVGAAVTGSGEIVKAGAGEVTLHGSFAEDVDLDVESGKLTVVPLEHCTWFRFTIKQLVGKEQSNFIVMQISELQLFDAVGNLLGSKFERVDSLAKLAPGKMHVTHPGNPNEEVENLFDGLTTKWCVIVSKEPMPSDPSTWLVVTFCLPNDSAMPVAYNIKSADATQQYSMRNLKRWTFEASVNGEDWAVVDDRSITGDGPLEDYVTYSDTNYPLIQPVQSRASTFGTVRVAAGAELNMTHSVPVSGLVVDVTAGAGSVNQLQLVPGGTLDLENVTGDLPIPFDVPLTVTDTLSGSVANWTIRTNGERLSGRRLRILDNKLQILKNGLTVYVR